MANFMWLLMIMLPGGVCGLSFTSIGSANGGNIFECNANVTLVCKTERGQDSIVFKINDIQAANCVHGCYVNTPILGNYTLSHDFDGGIIRLHIHKVSVADASNTFTCEGDSTSISINPVIKVYPEKSSTKIIINETNSVVEIEAITGCVLLHTNLYFVWNKTRSSNGMFLEPLLEEDVISISPVSEGYSNCISSDHCGGTARSNTLTFTEETSGGTYYFITCTIVIDKHDTGNVTQTYTVISERNFAFKDPSEKNSLLGMGLGLGFGVGLTTFATFIIVFLIKDPVFAVKVLSRKIVGNTVTVTIQWKCRLHTMKRFHVKLNNHTHSETVKLSKCEDGVFKHELNNLNLDSNYSANVYSTMWKFQSCSKRIYLDTNVAPPLPPINLCEDKALKTPSSLTLKWNRVEGPEHHFVIKYQRIKGRSREWMFTEKINDTKYTINGLKPNTSYTFIIHAENDFCISEDSKPLILKTRVLKPICPEDFRCISVKENEVMFSWKPCRRIKKQEFILTIYNLSEECKPEKTRQDTHICIPDTENEVITHKVTDLKPGSKYLFELFSAAGKLISERSAITSVETEGLPDSPKKFNVVESNETTVTVEWTPGKYRKYPQEFLILFRMEGAGDETQWSIIRVEDRRDPLIQHTITKLQEGKSYKFKLRAQNAIGHTELTDALLIETKGKPDPPSEFREVKNERTSKSITVSWVPGAYRGDTQKFVIKYRRLRQNGWNHNEIDDDGQPSMKHTIERLIAGKRYNITINAVNHTGSSETSDPLKVKTNGLLPEPPTEFICLNVTETDVQLSWKPEIYRRKQSFWLTWEQKGTQFSSIIDYDETTMSVDQSISNLAPGTIYEFFLWSFFGQLKDKKLSERSAVQVVTTKGLPEEPRNFCHLDTLLTEKTATFTWEPGCYRNYEQTFVISYYYTENNEQHLTEDTVEDTYESTIRHTVSNLEEGKQYVFSLKAENLIGFSKTSSVLNVQTKGTPEPPTDFRIIRTTPTSIIAGWTPGMYRREMQHFVINYRRATKARKLKWKTKICTVIDSEEQKINYELTELKTETEYELYIFAKNCFGPSDSTPKIKAVTEEETSDEDIE